MVEEEGLEAFGNGRNKDGRFRPGVDLAAEAL